MHFSTFVIIGRHDDPESAVARTLQPFDEESEVAPYRDYLDSADISRMAEHYGIPATDLRALAAKMNDWRGCTGGVDRRGLYAIATYNPNGKWDWYEIGGRWDGSIPRSHDNVISTRALCRSPRLQACLPYYLVTPDGDWRECEGAPAFGTPQSEADKQADAHWFATVRKVLARFLDHRVVCVDVHS